jgi:hypothetical protein
MVIYLTPWRLILAHASSTFEVMLFAFKCTWESCRITGLRVYPYLIKLHAHLGPLEEKKSIQLLWAVYQCWYIISAIQVTAGNTSPTLCNVCIRSVLLPSQIRRDRVSCYCCSGSGHGTHKTYETLWKKNHVCFTLTAVIPIWEIIIDSWEVLMSFWLL